MGRTVRRSIADGLFIEGAVSEVQWLFLDSPP
jgi:hypothetical protein